MRKIKHILEYILVKILFTLCCILPFAAIRFLATFFGIFAASLPLSMNRIARENLRLAFPDKNEKEIQKLHEQSTINITQTFLEMPKTYNLSRKNFEKCVRIEGWQHVEENPNLLVLTAHLGNWDMILKGFSIKGVGLSNVYRKANNPFVDKLITKTRTLPYGQQFPKGKEGGRALIKAIKEGKPVGFLNDQRMSDGVKVPLFGKEAPTASALAELALKFKRPVCPVICIRKKEGFQLIIDAPVNLPEDATKATALFNQILEEKIRTYPEQWMWMHKRFS